MLRELPMIRLAWSAVVPVVLLVLVGASSDLRGADFCLGPRELYDGPTGLRAHLNDPSEGECLYCVGGCGEDTTDWLLVSLTVDDNPYGVQRVLLRALGDSPETGGFIPPVGVGCVYDGGWLPADLGLEFNEQYDVYIGALFPYSPMLHQGQTTTTLFAAYPAWQLESIGSYWQLGLELSYGAGTVFFHDHLEMCPAASVPEHKEPTWGTIKSLFRE